MDFAAQSKKKGAGIERLLRPSFLYPFPRRPLLARSYSQRACRCLRYLLLFLLLPSPCSWPWAGRYREDVMGPTAKSGVSAVTSYWARSANCRQNDWQSFVWTPCDRINGLDYRPGRAATFSEFIEVWKAQMRWQPTDAAGYSMLNPPCSSPSFSRMGCRLCFFSGASASPN
jgi:hypothetical protein